MKLHTFLPVYRQNLTLAVPVILSQVGQVIVQLVDNAMVGRLGAEPLAAVSFGGALFMIFFMFATGLTMGVTPLVGSSFAQRDHKRSSICLQNSLLLYAVLGVLLFISLRVVECFMDRMGQSEAVVMLARPYFRYLAWSIIPFMLFAAFKQFLEGVGNTKVAMVIVLTSNVVNIIFNYLLIYGHAGFPAMGAPGAGLSTLISRILMPILIVAYFYWRDSLRRYFTFFRKDVFNLRMMKMLLGIGLPISLQMSMEMSAFSLSSVMMGWISPVAQAGHQIALSISSFTFMTLVGIAAAATIRVSHAYGAGNLRELGLSATASYHIGLLYSSVAGILLILLRHEIPLLFTSDKEVVDMAATLLICTGIYQISDGLQTISLGILRGLQDVRISMVYAFVSYILLNLPVGYLCAFVLGMGAPGLWVGFIVGLSMAAVLLHTRYRRQYGRLQRGERL